MLKASLGTGILAIPHAFKNSGYLVGIIGTIVIGLFSCYCIHMMVVAQYVLCKKKKIPSLTYPEIAETALSEGPPSVRWLAPYGRIVSFGFLVVCELGASCIYVIFVAGNLKAVSKKPLVYIPAPCPTFSTLWGGRRSPGGWGRNSVHATVKNHFLRQKKVLSLTRREN
ncbi:proton-coupled amino acid transporter-like protein CG1139 [Diaphorina citri]|uniref:Proton-coupled amino acid transporter-like protein CG1139 n=1 Tax=Diaphorina citri TaxID=121845 RepID=A0A3Q0J334_DIACI|nr:proton-coupled amino acid transporter-like protein CG1139 [Diaphorina citri]